MDLRKLSNRDREMVASTMLALVRFSALGGPEGTCDRVAVDDSACEMIAWIHHLARMLGGMSKEQSYALYLAEVEFECGGPIG